MVQLRKEPMVNDNVYHICSQSIAKFVVFNNTTDYLRFINMIKIYNYVDFKHKYSRYREMSVSQKDRVIKDLDHNNKLFTDIICYCLMPTHIHLVLKQNIDMGISKYMSKILNSYSKYFNIKYKRKGPLWASRFNSVHVKDNEQLLHLTRYVHLNPTSARLVQYPENWKYSSYKEYLSKNNNICKYDNMLDINQTEYKKFIDDRKNYQKELSIIKNQIIH